jgi:N-terminal acetyltransferase B complex non-catalytic subunit
MYRKRLKNVYELLEAGNNKKVIQEVDKLLSSSTNKKKGPVSTQVIASGAPGYDEEATMIIAKALKALALVRTGKKQESDVIIDELLNTNTNDDNVLSIIMQYCKETQQLSKIVSFYENAANKCEKSNSIGTKEHEDILSSLFFAYVRNRLVNKQQQLALKLYKQTNQMMYCFWNAASYVMIYKSNPEKNGMYLQLAEKILQKAYEDQKMEYSGEYQLFLNIMEERGKFEDAFKIIDAFDEQANLSKIGLADFKIKKKIFYLKKLRKWSEAMSLCESHITNNLDDWLYYLDHIESLVELYKETKCNDSIKNALKLFSTWKEKVDTSSEIKAQGPYLARIELFKQASEHASSELTESLLKEYLADYIHAFQSKPGFFYDLIYFNELIKKFKLNEYILSLLKDNHDQNRPFKSIKAIYTCLSYWQLNRYFGKQEQMNEKELTELAIELEKMYEEALEFGKDLLSTAFQYADEFIILAVHIRYDLYKTYNSSQNNLVQLVSNLKQALTRSPSNYQLKLLLLNLYSHLGAYQPMKKMYDSMEIKNIQNYSTANLLLVHCIRLGLLSSATGTCATMDQFFTVNLFDMANFLVNCYKFGTFLKAIEIISFMDTIQQSLALNISAVNSMTISFMNQSFEIQAQNEATTQDLIDFKSLKQKLEQHFRNLANVSNVFDPETGLLPNENQTLDRLLQDHTDKEVLYHWDTIQSREIANKQYEFIVCEQRRLLKLRNSMTRFIHACIDSWFNEQQQQHNENNSKFDLLKKNLIEFDYELDVNMFKGNSINNNSKLNFEDEDLLDSELRIYVTKSNYFKRFYLLGSNKIINDFINLTCDLCQNNTFLDDEQSNGQQTLTKYRDSLKQHFDSMREKINKLVLSLRNESANIFKLEYISRILESFSCSLEAISYVVLLYALCLTSSKLKPIWSEKTKKSKKKKSQYAQYAPCIDVLFEIYELLCALVNFFVQRLKQDICPHIVQFVDKNVHNIQPTILSKTTQTSHLSDLPQSYLKSFEDLKIAFNQKLDMMLKLSGNPSTIQLPQIDSLKLSDA